MRLIDADALKEEVNKKKVVGRFNTLLLIDNAPTVEPKQGEWITEYDRLKCPFCGMSIDDEVHWLYSEEYNFNFCPNCGAKMKGGAKNG